MKYIKQTLCFILFLGFSQLQAQTAYKDALMNDYHYVQSKIRPMAEDLGNIEGTPYYKDTFQDAYLFFEDRDPVPAKIRYNIVKEEMQVRFDEHSFQILHDGIVVALDDSPFQKFSYRGEDKSVDLLGYFEVLTEDYKDKNLILLEKHKKEVKEGVKKPRMQMPFPPKYIEESDYYLKFNNSTKAQLVPRGRNDFLDLFPKEQRDELKSFMKENNLKPKKEEDLAVIVDHYNANF